MYRPLEKRNCGGNKPFKFKTPTDLQNAIENYFAYCDKNKQAYIVSGLAYAIGTNRQTLIDYQNRDEYEDIILDAKRKIEAYAEQCLFTKQNPAGVIFSLKNNWGWRDKQEIETNVSMNMADVIHDARTRVKSITDGTVDVEAKEFLDD